MRHGYCRIDRRLIGWQSTRRQQTQGALPVLTARYEEQQGHAPGERASYVLACQAADQTRSPKQTELWSLTELRKRWRDSAIRAFGACTVYRLAERARAAAAVVWARVRPVVDLALGAVDVVAVVYGMRGAFARHHLLAEARRHLAPTGGKRHGRGPGRSCGPAKCKGVMTLLTARPPNSSRHDQLVTLWGLCFGDGGCA